MIASHCPVWPTASPTACGGKDPHCDSAADKRARLPSHTPGPRRSHAARGLCGLLCIKSKRSWEAPDDTHGEDSNRTSTTLTPRCRFQLQFATSSSRAQPASRLELRLAPSALTSAGRGVDPSAVPAWPRRALPVAGTEARDRLWAAGRGGGHVRAAPGWGRGDTESMLGAIAEFLEIKPESLIWDKCD